MSKIEWTDSTLNPVVGCSKVSPGCDHCYAVRMANRLASNPRLPEDVRRAYSEVVTDGKWNGQTRLIESVLDKPLHWKKPRRVFVGSMTDLFHHETPAHWKDRVFDVILRCPHHTFQLLTKRPNSAAGYLHAPGRPPIPPNVWLGATVEDQQRADERIPHLLKIDAAVRFLSLEPLLGPVDIRLWLPGLVRTALCGHHTIECSLCGEKWMAGQAQNKSGLSYLNAHLAAWGENHLQVTNPKFGHVPVGNSPCSAPRIHWVIVGGETGPGARPMHPQWVRDIRDQCRWSGVPLFFKSWGKHVPKGQDQHTLDGCKWNEFPGR